MIADELDELATYLKDIAQNLRGDVSVPLTDEVDRLRGVVDEIRRKMTELRNME